MDKLFLEIPVMKRLFPSLLCLTAPTPPAIPVSLSLRPSFTHAIICNWTLKRFKDSADTLPPGKAQSPRSRLRANVFTKIQLSGLQEKETFLQ